MLRRLVIPLFALLLLIVHPHVAFAQNSVPEDLDDSGFIDWADLTQLIAAFGTSNGLMDFNINGLVDIFDFVHIVSLFGTEAVAPPPSGDAAITLRHPYQFNEQPAITKDSFGVTYWVDNWDVQPGGKHVELTIEEMNVTTTQVTELSQTYKDFKDFGPTYYDVNTCGTVRSLVSKQDYFDKDRIAVSGLTPLKYYRLTVELMNGDGTGSGVKSQTCIEVNPQVLNTLPHVMKSNGFGGQSRLPHLQFLVDDINKVRAQQGDIPPCPDHDEYKHHFIYDPVRHCHYDHEHKDDPNRDYYDDPSRNRRTGGVNTGRGDALSVFGRTWEWLPAAYKDQLPSDQTNSYPWQTWGGVDIGNPPVDGKMENQVKHNGYYWFVRTPDDFGTNNFCDTGAFYIDTCITHMRVAVHAVSGMPGALTHTHSLWIEARICSANSNGGLDENECGIYRGGGHIQYGRFGTNIAGINNTGGNQVFPPYFYTDGASVGGGVRLHGAMHPNDIRAAAKDFTWYPSNDRPSIIGIRGDSWGPMFYFPTNDTGLNVGGYNISGPDWSQIRRELFYCSDPTRCRGNNGAVGEMHFVIIRTRDNGHYGIQDEEYNDSPAGHLDKDSRAGFFSYTGFTNRWGDLQTNGQCDNKPMGVDCVPVSYEGVPINGDAQEAQHRDSSVNIPDYNYDVSPYDVDSQGNVLPSTRYWVQFPN